MSRLPAFDGARPRTPNFFLVGAPKTGTSSLYAYLDQHPQIFMSPMKEPHYLADEVRLGNFSEELRRREEPRLAELRAYLDGPMTAKFSTGFVTELADYLKLFQGSQGEPVLGEASVCYLWSPTAPGNIARMCPEAKILMILRDPADRAYSQYLQLLTLSQTFLSFRDYIDAGLHSTSTLMGPLYPFLCFGQYYGQVKRYLQLFPREQIHILFYEDFQRDARGAVGNIFKFLGVNRDFVPDMKVRHMLASVPRSHVLHRLTGPAARWSALRQISPPRLRSSLKRLLFRPRESMTMDPSDRAFLVDFYREDIGNLSGLLDRDLSAWLLAR